MFEMVSLRMMRLRWRPLTVKAMERKPPIKDTLQRIDAEGAYDDLTPYRQAGTWEALSSEERELLAKLFIAQGLRQVSQELRQATESWELAETVAPKSGLVMLALGQAYASQAKHPRCLARAQEHLIRAQELLPENSQIYSERVKVLIAMALEQDDSTPLLEADRLLEAIAHQEGEPLFPHYELELLWAKVWRVMGQLSGEACDYHRSLEHFRCALKEETGNAELWRDYASICLAQAEGLGQGDLLFEAVCAGRRALELAGDDMEAHACLVRVHVATYQHTGDREAFDQAFAAVADATERAPDNPDFWLQWGQLCARESAYSGDVKFLELAIDKLTTAFEFSPEDPEILCALAKVHITFGASLDELDAIRLGEELVTQASQIAPESKMVLETYCYCLLELGRYFEDASYGEEARRRVELGLEHFGDSAGLHQILADILQWLGILSGDVSLFDASNRSYSYAAEHCKGDGSILYNVWGVSLMRLAEQTQELRHIEAAVSKFERAVRDRGNDADPEWWYNYGCALDFLGDHSDAPQHYEKAIQVLSHAITLDPDYHFARHNLALAWLHLGELTADPESYHRAIDLMESLLESEPRDELVLGDLGAALLSLAQLVGDPAHPDRWDDLIARAEARLTQAVSMGNTQALYTLACLFSVGGQLDTSMLYLERAENAAALPALDDLMHDEWLVNVRDTQAFRAFIGHLTSQ